MRLLLLDHYDSFTWNLVHALTTLGAEVQVELSDAVDPGWVLAQDFDAVVLSPGPGAPEEAGIGLELVRRAAGRLPLLGVCLGHQVLARAFGGRVVRAPTLVHGKTSPIDHDGRGVFRGLPRPFAATRYHSLAVDPAAPGEGLEIAAASPDGVVMGLRHRRLPLHGVQFHPESVLTLAGPGLLANFLEIAAAARCRSGSAA